MRKELEVEKLLKADLLLEIQGTDKVWRPCGKSYVVKSVEATAEKLQIWLTCSPRMPWVPEPGQLVRVERKEGPKTRKKKI